MVATRKLRVRALIRAGKVHLLKRHKKVTTFRDIWVNTWDSAKIVEFREMFYVVYCNNSEVPNEPGEWQAENQNCPAYPTLEAAIMSVVLVE